MRRAIRRPVAGVGRGPRRRQRHAADPRRRLRPLLRPDPARRVHTRPQHEQRRAAPHPGVPGGPTRNDHIVLGYGNHVAALAQAVRCSCRLAVLGASHPGQQPGGRARRGGPHSVQHHRDHLQQHAPTARRGAPQPARPAQNPSTRAASPARMPSPASISCRCRHAGRAARARLHGAVLRAGRRRAALQREAAHRQRRVRTVRPRL